MSRNNPARFVLSVAAEVAAVVFIVSVLPRVDLRTSAGAAPTSPVASWNQANEAPSLLPRIADWPAAAESRRDESPFETSHYQRRTQPATARESNRQLPPREPTPLISVDPARPDYVEQRLDRASQDLVNTVGSYVSQAANDLLNVPPPQPTAPQQSTLPPRTIPPSAGYRSPSGTPIAPANPPTGSFSTMPALPSAFPTQPQPQPRPWVRY